MSSDGHGSSPAAWTAVIIITLAFAVGTLALILGNWPMFWVGAALVVVAVGHLRAPFDAARAWP